MVAMVEVEEAAATAAVVRWRAWRKAMEEDISPRV